MEFDTRQGEFIQAWASIAGTVTNCAGGPTPWGRGSPVRRPSRPGSGNALTKPHGYIYEVPAFGTTTREPLKAMGRFVHEANATDPHTGIVYETEDAGFTSGFYRYVPNQRGKLADGVLQMLAIDGKPGYNTRLDQVQDEPLDVVWVTIDTPDPWSRPARRACSRRDCRRRRLRQARGRLVWSGQDLLHVDQRGNADRDSLE